MTSGKRVRRRRVEWLSVVRVCGFGTSGDRQQGAEKQPVAGRLMIRLHLALWVSGPSPGLKRQGQEMGAREACNEADGA
jgi:hypothetical protein